MQTKTRRGPSAASIDAAKYLAKNPGTEALALAKKFNINITTVYRSAWWKNRDKTGDSK